VGCCGEGSASMTELDRFLIGKLEF
jgi:hypothetical protein